MPELLFGGVDVGSLSTDFVIIDNNDRILSWIILPTGINGTETARQARLQALEQAGLKADDLKAVIATGYGRSNVDFASGKTTEISCHAMGAHHLFPMTGTVIDIGGQDSKVIQIDARGHMLDFNMNDKCSAGTGRFFEVMAQRLDLELSALGDPKLVQGKSAPISSTCTVFADSEVISLMAQHTPREQIIHGLQISILNRIWSMVARIGIVGEVTLTGGVALNRGLVTLFEAKLGQPVNVPDQPQIVGALGAALIARRQHLRAAAHGVELNL